MTGGPSRAVLRPGDWVSFDGGEHQVLALVGTSVRLRARTAPSRWCMASYLMAAPDFTVTGGDPVPAVEPFGLLDSLPERYWPQRGSGRSATWSRWRPAWPRALSRAPYPRPEYDPQARTLAQRTQAMAAALGIGVRTVNRMRAQYEKQGLWGLVDRRAVRAHETTGRADARLVAVARQVIEAETHASTGTRGRLIRRVTKAVEDAYGPGTVPLPGVRRSTSSSTCSPRAAHVRVGGHPPTGREPPGAAARNRAGLGDRACRRLSAGRRSSSRPPTSGNSGIRNPPRRDGRLTARVSRSTRRSASQRARRRHPQSDATAAVLSAPRWRSPRDHGERFGRGCGWARLWRARAS